MPKSALWRYRVRHKSNNHLVTINGETRCLTEWAEISGLKLCCLLSRISLGWPPERLLDPIAPTRQPEDKPLHSVWKGMRRRCEDPKYIGWERYGKRGIRVCERWRRFMTFKSDMGPKPSPGHQIERIDPNGNYEPGNCRWATTHEQARNKRTTVLITIGDETRCLSDWSEISGIDRKTLRQRLDAGWPSDRLLEPGPVKEKRAAEHGGPR